MNIFFDETGETGERLTELMIQAGTEAVLGEKLDPELAEVSVSFVSDERIRELNREYRHVDKVTDVLSFPQFDDLNLIPDGMEFALGDVVICMQKIEEQAEEFGHSKERETLYLFTHSMLHLLGYDHMTEEDKALMRKREEEIMEKIGLSESEVKCTKESSSAEGCFFVKTEEGAQEKKEDEMLYREAVKAFSNSYSPYSNFRVGAAILTYSGEIFTGANIENASYGGTICAERVAAVKAISEGYRDFRKIAIAAEKGEAPPCGICRQFLYEFGADITVIFGETETDLKRYSLRELLPEGFNL